MPIKRTEEQVDRVIKDTKKVEKNLNRKKSSRKKRGSKNKKHESTNGERMIAPILLIITILISYLVMLMK